MHQLRGFRILTVLLSLTAIVSCKKDKLSNPDTPPHTTNRTELTKDSIYLYAKQVYLWNSQLPTYASFKPRSYNTLTDILLGIASEAINPSNELPYEYWAYFDEEPKFSYVDDTDVSNGSIAIFPEKKAYIDLDGSANDIGLGLEYLEIEPFNGKSYAVYVKYVSPGSPAAELNIKRGTIINRINGRKYGGVGSDFGREIDDLINNIERNTVQLNVTDLNNNTYDIVLNKKSYVSSPVYKDTVFTRGTNNIGYLAYARFSDEANSIAALNNVFSNFAAKNVNSLIIDLRYNGGGYVSTAEKLINLIVPAEYNGRLLFTETYNRTMQEGKADLLKNQFYTDANGRKISYAGAYTGNLVKSFVSKASSNYLNDIRKVVFIVGSSTASSSELVINSLRGLGGIDVKLIGKQTFGKPIGFFPIRIDKYDVYYSMFETKNALGFGGYYEGFNVDKDVFDDYDNEFGDPAENNTAAAIAYILTGSFPSGIQSRSMEQPRVLHTDKTLLRDGFRGMIETPNRLFGR